MRNIKIYIDRYERYNDYPVFITEEKEHIGMITFREVDDGKLCAQIHSSITGHVTNTMITSLGYHDLAHKKVPFEDLDHPVRILLRQYIGGPDPVTKKYYTFDGLHFNYEDLQ